MTNHKFRLNKILCATDFSKFSKQVISCGIGMAARFNANLLIFHSISFPRDPIHGNPILNPGMEKKRLADRAHEKICELMKDCQMDWEPVIKFGDPVEEAGRASQEYEADMVVAASYGLSGLKRILFGTVIERMARTITLPLLVVPATRRVKGQSDVSPPESSLEFRRIVAGFDLSADSDPVIDYALGIAAEFKADLHFLHAVESPIDQHEVKPPDVPYEASQQTLQEQLYQQFASRLPEDAFKHCNLKLVLMPGVPGERLSLYAEEIQADLIIVGVKSHSVLEQLLIGSTTEFVLRHVRCPVLVIP